jgi:adenylate kinase
MKISLTGTPGTGKTSISNFLSKNNIKTINLNNYILKNIKFEFDNKRKTKIIDISALNNSFNKNYINQDLLIIEGHLSHLLNYIDKIIILRCHPTELKRRLLKRKWNIKKINENIQSEILDIILCECLINHKEKNIFEIDTTNISIKSLGLIILDLIKNNFRGKNLYKIGNIDWLEQIDIIKYI